MEPIQNTFSVTTEENKAIASIRLSGVVPASVIEKHRTSTLEDLQKTTTIDGFRQGTAPLTQIEKKVGELEVWRQSSINAITEAFPTIIAESTFIPVSQPNLQLSSVPIRGDVGFTIDFFTLPAITLPDYRTILSTLDPLKPVKTVEESAVEQVILDVRRGLYRNAHPEKPLPTDDKHLPELTDETVASLTSTCSDVANFRKKIRDDLLTERQEEERQLHRETILTKIKDAVGTIVIPEILIEEGAKDDREAFELRAKRLGTTVEAYCKDQNIQEEDLQKDLRERAKKRSEVQLILNAIREKETINPDKEMVEKELKRFKERSGEADEEKARIYIETMLANESVLTFLEGLVKK